VLSFLFSLIGADLVQGHAREADPGRGGAALGRAAAPVIAARAAVPVAPALATLAAPVLAVDPDLETVTARRMVTGPSPVLNPAPNPVLDPGPSHRPGEPSPNRGLALAPPPRADRKTTPPSTRQSIQGSNFSLTVYVGYVVKLFVEIMITSPGKEFEVKI
jgi:hypothetical protein